MEKPTVDELAQRLERLERENRRWKYLAGFTALVLTLSFTLSGLLGSRAVIAQQPEEKAGNPAIRRMEYKVTLISEFAVLPLEKSIRDMTAEGWEIVQVVPTLWRTLSRKGLMPGEQGESGAFNGGYVVARPPLLGSVGHPVGTSMASRPRSPHPCPTPRMPASGAASHPSARPQPSSASYAART
jgi:hypothetical protein